MRLALHEPICLSVLFCYRKSTCFPVLISIYLQSHVALSHMYTLVQHTHARTHTTVTSAYSYIHTYTQSWAYTFPVQHHAQKEAIFFACDLLTRAFKPPKDQLYVTYFGRNKKYDLEPEYDAWIL